MPSHTPLKYRPGQADPNIADSEGCTPLHLVAQSGIVSKCTVLQGQKEGEPSSLQTGLVKLLASHASTNGRLLNAAGLTPTELAMQNGGVCSKNLWKNEILSGHHEAAGVLLAAFPQLLNDENNVTGVVGQAGWAFEGSAWGLIAVGLQGTMLSLARQRRKKIEQQEFRRNWWPRTRTARRPPKVVGVGCSHIRLFPFFDEAVERTPSMRKEILEAALKETGEARAKYRSGETLAPPSKLSMDCAGSVTCSNWRRANACLSSRHRSSSSER